MQDEGYARELAKLKSDGKLDEKSAPRWETWSPEREALARIEDQLKSLGQTMVGAFGGKPKEVKPAQRPETKIGKATATLRSEEHKKLASRMIAGRKRL
jgi:hypothetical protein